MSTTVNLGIKYDKQIQQQFTLQSLLQGRLENDLDFVGAKTVRIHTIATVPVNDYDRGASGNRYGTPQEVGDTVQELTMSQDKGFSGIIDKGNNLDQAINKAGKFLKVQMDERMIPLKDSYGFKRLAALGGTIVGSGTALSASNVVARVAAARSAFLNGRVPLKGRTWYVRTEVFDALADTEQFKQLDRIGSKTLVKGQIGELYGAPVVEVPADLMPEGVNFMLLHKSAASSPSKIADTKVHVDPPGISGNLVEGRFYWDMFVFGAKAGGIYVDVTTSSAVKVLAAVTVAPATGAITGVTTGAEARYTTDGSDPRYSMSAKTGTAPDVKAGDVVKACQVNTSDEKVYTSPVVTVEVTG